ncbi:DNA repair protein RecN [Thioalkalivibrio nitratireducens DSM 14787]|uniref:DNA repair protein RecN n=1 Tax=Thioalkalivibrio nitratireducens (strain DSM 14787 / UNIQEM 213 / ALEN2) TaxID=1255043 RepID=L0E0L7_THIND|nr:DNA repair protein RecN [Thioalkalivibrio nitratireducens]AGA34792.1 DNA repair protein RecN [Thioalkalivibrio nitratireducens DSM 14787]
MLRHITVRDFAIIDHLELSLGAGMTALTGETGAGKSILIDVIGLLLGDRADAASVRDGTAQADLSAEFELRPGHPTGAWLRGEALAELADDPDTTHVLLRRVITAQGKSRAWINGRPVTVAQLKTVGKWLVDIHGQHAHQQLLQRPAQRALLDGFVAVDVRREVTAAHAELQATSGRLDTARERLASASDRLDLLRFQAAEIRELGPHEGEFEEIAGEQTRLAHAAEVLGALQAAHQAIDDDAGIDPGLGQVLAGLQKAARHDSRVEPVLELLESARIQVQEAGDQLRRMADRIEINPERLAEVDARVAAYLRLARKHRTNPDALPGLLHAMEAEQKELDAGDAAVAALEQDLAAAQARYDRAAEALSQARRAAAARLDPAVTETMQELGMTGGQFRIELQERPDEAGPQGRDRIEFLVSANPGSSPQPLARVASGGELSRIGLALQVLASAEQAADSLIFDEVDSGISGAVAEVVGRKLRALGARYQVLCVTHLPQVAAQAHCQFQVSKYRGRDHARTEITRLAPGDRIEAVARMLGGVTLTERSLEHAREMLEAAAGEPAGTERAS